MVKVTATGLYKGVSVTLQCVKTESSIKLFKNGVEDTETQAIFQAYIKHKRSLVAKYSWLWKPETDSAEAYWAAFHEIYFDKPPIITVEGKLSTFGSPYSNEDTSGFIF